MKTDKARRVLDRLQGKKNHLLEEQERLQDLLKEQQQDEIDIRKAQVIIQQVAQTTQGQLEYHVSELVSLAMKSIFVDPYTMHLDFVLRRGKSEADLTFSSPGSDDRIDPMTTTGGGSVDVASYALRLALWSLQRPRTRATIAMDEPFRFLSKDLQPKASQMLAMISKKLGLQMLIVTHEEALVECADKIFTARQRRDKDGWKVSYLEDGS